MKKILVHGVKEKTPMGFCDVPRKNLLDFLRDMKSISVPNEPRYKPLRKIHQAASEGDTDRLRRMISLGKHSVHDRDFKQRTALHFACAYGQVEVVSVLLRNNCDIDAADVNFITPLMKAVQNWTYECVCILLKHGADPNHMDKNGNTPLHYAVSEDNQTLAKCLLKYSANMEQKNKDGFTPLLLALKENKIEMAKFLVKMGANIHVFDEMKRNTLLYAIRWDSKDMVNLLLDEGIDFFFRDVFGWTALRYAIEGTSKGSREILMNYDEMLRRKNKDGIPEYKNFEDKLLDKHPNDPTSGSSFPKSNEKACEFDDEADISKYVLTTCPNNIHGAGEQGDKSETKGAADVQVWTNPTLKSSTKGKVPNLNEVGTMTESHHFIKESDLKIESLEETFSYDNEDKQSVSDDGHFSGTTPEWCQNDTNRKTTDCMYPNLKSSTEGKMPTRSKTGKMAEPPHFIIESDLEIESLEETVSCDSEDKQLLYLPQIDGSHFSEAANEGPENNLERQMKESAKKYPYLKIVNEINDLSQNTCLESKDEETLNSELTITSTSEEQKCNDVRGKAQSMQTGPMDYLVTVKTQREENMRISQEKDSPEEQPEHQCSTEKTYSIAHEESDSSQEDSSHAEQVVELTSEEEQKKEDDNDNKQCLNIFKRLRPKRIGSLFMTRDKNEESTVTAEEKEIPKEYCQLKTTTEEGESMSNDSPAKKNKKSLQTESAIIFIPENGQKCQLDSEKKNQRHMFKQSQPKMTSHLSVTEGQSDESTINGLVKDSINYMDSQEELDIKSELDEEQKSHGNGEKSQHEHMFKLPWPKSVTREYFGKYQRGEGTVNVEKKDPPEKISECKATNERKEYVSDSNSSMMDVKTSCVDSPKEHTEWRPTMETKECIQKDISITKCVQFREESNLKIETKENLDGDETSQPPLSLGLTSTSTDTLNEGGKGFQKTFLELKPPTEMKDSDSTEASAMMHRQGFLADVVDIKLETESQDYPDNRENIQSTSKCTPHLSVGITSRSTILLTEGEKDFHKKNPDWKPTQYLIGSKALASSEVSMLKHKQEFLPEGYLQMKTEESQKNLNRNENIQSSNAVIQPNQILHLQIGLALRPTDLLNEGKKGFCVNYSEQKSSIEENYVPIEESAVRCGQEFPAEADWKIKAEDFQENLDDNESIQSFNSFKCLQPRPSPYLSLELTQRSKNLLNEGGKGLHKTHPEGKKTPSTEREDSLPFESSVWEQEQEHPSEVGTQMKAVDKLQNLDGSEISQSSDTMPDLPLCHMPLSSTPMDLLNKGGKVKDESMKNQNHLESNTHLSDSIMHLPLRHIPHSSTGITPRFTNPPNAGEEDLQMKLEENQKNIDGNESIQSYDNVKHLQPRRIRHLLMGLIPRPMNILSRRGKDSHKKCAPWKNSIEIKEFDPNAQLERQEIKTFTSVMFEDDQNLCDGSKNNQPLVEATRKKHTYNEIEDAAQSCGCALAATAHDVSTASVVAAIVAATVVAAAAPAAAAAAASAAVAAVFAAAAPAAAAVASATAAVDALADVSPGAAPDSSAVPVAAATAATAAAVPAAAAAGAPDAAPAVVAAAAAAAAAAVAVTSVAAASLTAVSAASVAAVVAVAVTARAGLDAPTVAPAAAAVAAVAAATGPAAAAALVASVAATAVTPRVPPAAPASAAAPSTVAAATAAAAAVATHAAASPAVAAAAAAAAAVAVAVPTDTKTTVAAVASSDTPTAAPVAVDVAAGGAAATKGRLNLQRKYVEEGKQQSPTEEAEKHDGYSSQPAIGWNTGSPMEELEKVPKDLKGAATLIKKTTSTETNQVLKPVKDKHDHNALTPVMESCSAEYLGSPSKSTPAFDSYKELLELKEVNVQILTEKTKVENELSEVKEENSQLEKKIVRKNERICTLRSIIKEQVEKKRSIICAYNEVVGELRNKEEMIQRRGEQDNRQVTGTQELEICLKTRDEELKQLQKEKEHAQQMEDHLQILELENTSLIATVKKQKEEIEHLQRYAQNPHKNLAQSSKFTETAAQENQNTWNNHTTVITEMENLIKNLKSEVSSVKISKEFSKKELEKYKRFYLEELRNKNFLLHELNRTNESREQSHRELHMKFQQNISASKTLNTQLVHECSCAEKTQKLESEDFLHGDNLVLPSSSTQSAHACVENYPRASEDDMRDLRKGLSDLKQSVQLSLKTQKKQDDEAGKERAGIEESFKMTDHRHDIGDCGSHGDFETCPLGAQATSKPYSEFLKESYTTSTINAMETKIRSLKSTHSKLKVSRALRVLELERYNYLYYEELSIRKAVQYYLNKSNENSENRLKFHMKTQHSSSAVNAQSTRPLTECSSTGYLDNIPGPGKNLLLRENQTASSTNSQQSTSGLEDCLKMMQQVSQYNYAEANKARKTTNKISVDRY